MQLICCFETIDYDAFRRYMDDDREARGAAGVNLLQIWREVGSDTRVWSLHEVSDRGRAKSWLDTREAGVGAGRAGVTVTAHHFLQTA